MAQPGEQHRHAIGVAIVDALLVADRTARLDDGIHTLAMCDLDAVRKREEGIARHHGPVQVEPERVGLFDGMAQSIDTRSLSYAARTELCSLGQNDSVRLGVLDDLVRKDQIGHLSLIHAAFGLLFGRRVQSAQLGIALLSRHAVQQRTVLHGRPFDILQAQQDTVFLAFEDRECLRFEIGRHEYLAEELVHLVGRSNIDLAVADQHAAECRYRIAGQRCRPCLKQSRTGSHTAGVVMLHVSGGTTIARGSSIPAPGTKMGSHAALTAEIKKHVSIPVTTVGRITEPWIAEELIANGKADACMIGRANLCDPEFANKAKEGREDDIRPCIGCLRCLNGIMFGKRVSCTVNPSFELENEDTLKSAEVKKDVLVIGGGGAGMEAAYVAAKRGHHVVLCEANDELGGALKAASVPIGKQDLTRVVKFMKRRLEQMDVDIRYNTTVNEEMLKDEFAGYEVIASTGAKPIILNNLTGFKQWMSADDILTGAAFPGRKIVVIGGGSVGCETADYLAPVVHDLYPRNREIIVLEMAKGIMMNESGPGRSLLVQRMMRKGIEMICEAQVTKVETDKIYYVKDGVEHCISDADTLVFAVGYKSDPGVEEMLKKANVSYHLIGDAHKVGNIKDAISYGYEIARQL